ncbi:MAG: carbohydrate binding family 9 domain-containing protein [Bacteroidales bacterium]|nr:carbohydrate binding family 9 domain-containing protein [Bacteroidales bacterium]
MRKLLFLSILFLLVISSAAQRSNPDTLIAFFTDDKITLDGKLTESCWQEAMKIHNFTQRELYEGEPATEKTEIAIIYNTNVLYIGFWGYDDEPDKIIAQKMSRDFMWDTDDNFEIIISSFNDNRNGYLFVTNPNGARADVLVSNEGDGFNSSWNGVWDVATTITDKGWFAEIQIPFSTLKFKKDKDLIWGINFERNIRRKKEQLLWQGWSRIFELEKISQAGKLVGLSNIKAKNRVELKPYVSGGVEKSNGENWLGKYKIGGDVNVDITTTLKLNLTINTDFAQVESDRARINLTRFSLYFPEKRQFFLEAKELFEMNMGRGNQVFYSRRIGLHDGQEVPIIAGVRMFGKQNRTSVGAMSIQTIAMDSIETTNYSVVRVRQDIGRQSSVGGIVTSKMLNGKHNIVYGADFTYSTSKIFNNKNLIINGAFSQSQTSDSINSINSSYSFSLSYPNDWIEYDLAVVGIQENFNPEMGFLRRNNYRMYYTELQFNPRPKFLPFFRNLILKPLDINYYVNERTNQLESIFYELRPFGFVTKSGEVSEFNVQWVFDKLDEPFELLDTIVIPVGEYWDQRWEIQLETFQGRRLSGEFYVNWGEFYTGSRTRLSTAVNLNINNHWNLSAEWSRNYLFFDDLDFITDEVGGRVIYAYNPKLNTSLFGQWNNEDDEILFNYRINWIPKIGSDFYFVINQIIETGNNTLKLGQMTILAKLIWRFAL